MRYFKLATHLTVPRTLKPGPGNTHHRPEPGDVIALDDAACARESRFVNGRVKAGDMKPASEADYAKFCRDRALAEAKAADDAAKTQTAAPAAEGK